MKTTEARGGQTNLEGGSQRARLAWLRRLVARTRATIDRALHPTRRRRAQRLLRGRQPPRSVLFVCEGNIYRSPYAAACLSAFLGSDGGVRVASAGFKGPDRSSPLEAQELARSRGFDLSSHRSRLLSTVSLGEWDLVVVMEPEQASRLNRQFGARRSRLLVLGDLDPQPIDRRAIADPWRSPELVLAGSYVRVERCVREFAATCWGSARGTSTRT